jgi:hypothetical protein
MEMAFQIDGVDGDLAHAAAGLQEDAPEEWSEEDFPAEFEDAIPDEACEQERLAQDVADAIAETHPLAVEADRLAELAGPLIDAADARLAIGGPAGDSLRLPIEVLCRSRFFVAVKVRRALSGREDPPIPGCDDGPSVPSDADGSAKIACLVCAAARDAAQRLAILDPDLAPQVAAFTRTADQVIQLIDETFPGHHAFRRPGFDDPSVAEEA